MPNNLMLSNLDRVTRELARDGVSQCQVAASGWRTLLVSELERVGFEREITVSQGTTIYEYNNLEKLKKENFLSQILNDIMFVDVAKKIKFDTLYEVVDQPGTIHRNQVYHFDTIPCLKLILNLKVDEASATEFVPGSHRGFWPKLNGLLFRLTRGRVSIASKGTSFLPDHDRKSSLKSVNYSNADGVFFYTDVYHRAGGIVREGRHIVIITFRFL